MSDTPIPKAIPPGTSAVGTRPLPPRPPQTPMRPTNNESTIAQQAQASYGVAGDRADLLYGTTGTTKTSRLGDIAEYLKRKYKKNSRLISADPGGWEVIQSLVDDGTVSAFALIQSRKNLYETMNRLCLGYWPQNPEDPQSPLVPPQQNGLKDVGGVFFEGLTSWCDLMMRVNTTDLVNVQVPRSEAEKFNKIKSGDFERRFASQTDYGSIQDDIAAFVRDSGMLPVKKVVWTALEQKGEDDQKKPVYGPDLIGRKATGRCGPWFGNFIHMDFMLTSNQVKAPAGEGTITVQKLVPVMFLRNHLDSNDPTKIPWPAKTRAPRTMWNAVPDFFEPRMDKFYEFMDGLLEKEKAERNK